MPKRVPIPSAAVRRAVARSLDVPEDAFPVLGEFFAPVHALGSVPRRMVNWLGDAGVGPRSRVLDLGCGKGAVSVALARSLSCRAVGVDAFHEFVESARALADRAGVARHCAFRAGLIEGCVKMKDRFDAVLILNVLPYERAVPVARSLTRPGGVYVFDDAVRVGRRDTDFACPTAEAIGEAVEHAGDRIERRRIWSAAEVRRRDTAAYRLIERAAALIVRQDARRAGVVRECLRRQRRAIAELSGPIRPACWLVRRASD